MLIVFSVERPSEEGALLGWGIELCGSSSCLEGLSSLLNTEGILTLPMLAIPLSPTLIKWWSRYVDDVHSATRKDQVNQLQEHLNSIEPHIKFTIELPETDRLPFLDTLTKPTPNSIESIVYRKTNHTDRYLDYNSNHPISANPSVIHILIHRAKQVCSTPEFLAEEIDHLHRVLHDNHYPTQFFQQSKPHEKPTKSQTHS